MPLNDLSSAQATLNLRSNPNSIWPDSRSVTPRMGFYAPCSVRPGFSVSRDDLIFTSGSCFARNIERELLKHGFDLIRPEDHTLMKELINKYVSRSVLNELRWGLGLEPFPLESLIQVEDGLWHDPHLHPNQQPVSFEHAMSRRGDIDRMVALLPRARIVILTLGLVETWYDTRTGAWLNGIPPASARSADPDRFRFVRQSFGDVMQDLEDIHGILDQHGHPDFKIVLTVSPVAFKATQTGQDAVAANTYSKSVLRAAAEEFCARHANVDYFPSFEMVTLSDRSIAFCPDNIHVQEDMVARVMQFFVENYAPEVERGPSSAPRVSMSAFYLAARQALSDGDFMVAARLLQQIEATADVASLGMDPAEFYFHLGTATASCGVKNRLLNTYAVRYFKKSLRYRSEPSHARAIAQVLKGLGFKEHQDFSERASEASPA